MKQLLRFFQQACALALLCLVATPALADEPAIGLTVGPYIQRVSDHNVTILAQTEAATSLTLYYKQADRSQWKKITSSEGTSQRFRLSKLKPGEVYEYYLADSEQRITSEYAFRTEKDVRNTDVLRIAAVGDSGSGLAAEYSIVSQMLRWEPEMILHTGDIAYYSGTTEEYIAKHFTPYQPLLAEVPFYGSIGNHDYTTEEAGPYKTVFELPQGNSDSEDYYSFNYDDVHIVSLNGNIDYSVDSAQYKWLESDLAAAQSQDWTIVFFHQPPYSSGSHGSTLDMADTIVPLFEEHGVDLVLNGHDHDYERNAKVNGVRYIVTGGGGHESLYAQTNLDLNPYSEYFNAIYHFLGVTVSNNNIKIRAIDSTGQIFDTVTVLKHK